MCVRDGRFAMPDRVNVHIYRYLYMYIHATPHLAVFVHFRL